MDSTDVKNILSKPFVVLFKEIQMKIGGSAISMHKHSTDFWLSALAFIISALALLMQIFAK